jgi:hypothetical protein
MPASVGEAVNLEIAAAFPSGVGACHPGAGHALYLEKPQEFNQPLARFAVPHSAALNNTVLVDRATPPSQTGSGE